MLDIRATSLTSCAAIYVHWQGACTSGLRRMHTHTHTPQTLLSSREGQPAALTHACRGAQSKDDNTRALCVTRREAHSQVTQRNCRAGTQSTGAPSTCTSSSCCLQAGPLSPAAWPDRARTRLLGHPGERHALPVASTRHCKPDQRLVLVHTLRQQKGQWCVERQLTSCGWCVEQPWLTTRHTHQAGEVPHNERHQVIPVGCWPVGELVDLLIALQRPELCVCVWGGGGNRRKRSGRSCLPFV
jgi:hypothetical protein